VSVRAGGFLAKNCRAGRGIEEESVGGGGGDDDGFFWPEIPGQGNMKYVLVTGGVVSGLGKGVTASSIGVVLKACGFRITSIKIGTCPPPPCLNEPRAPSISKHRNGALGFRWGFDPESGVAVSP
jgi:hypothetical protein